MKILVCLVLFGMQLSFSQSKKIEKDTIAVYQDIKQYSQKRKYTNFLHGLIFRSSTTKKSEKIIEPKPHLNVEGKIIRNIQITTLDPFGFSDIDTTATPKNWGERTGNRLHLKTKIFAIRNFLLFKENSIYDLFKIKETERIIRAQNFVNRVSITEKLTAPKSDSVDVFIRVIDTWSTIPKFSISSAKMEFFWFWSPARL
jgi:outer membrane protein assembly factor BamA